MRVLFPFTNERFDLGVELCFRVKIRDPQAVALEDAAPRLHLIHPGAVHQREVTERPGVLGSPLADLLAAVRPDVIAHEVNRLEVWGYLRIQLFKKGHELLLTLRGEHGPQTVPERVSNAANTFKVPQRFIHAHAGGG